MDDATRAPGPTPRYVPGETAAPRHAMPPEQLDEPWATDLDKAAATPRRAEVDEAEPDQSPPALPAEPGEASEPAVAPAPADSAVDAAGRSGPRRGYVIGLALFTVASIALVAWLILGYSGGRVTWEMLIPLVPWALLLLILWGQVIRQSAGRRRQPRSRDGRPPTPVRQG